METLKKKIPSKGKISRLFVSFIMCVVCVSDCVCECECYCAEKKSFFEFLCESWLYGMLSNTSDTERRIDVRAMLIFVRLLRNFNLFCVVMAISYVSFFIYDYGGVLCFEENFFLFLCGSITDVDGRVLMYGSGLIVVSFSLLYYIFSFIYWHLNHSYEFVNLISFETLLMCQLSSSPQIYVPKTIESRVTLVSFNVDWCEEEEQKLNKPLAWHQSCSLSPQLSLSSDFTLHASCKATRSLILLS